MTTLIAPGHYSAGGSDKFFADGTATFGDLPGVEPAVGDRILMRRPKIVRGRVVGGAARVYVVESVDTRETQVYENGVHGVRDVTIVQARLIAPGGN